jgi:polyhydroxyalkanoate synthesis repressor PhaR
MPLIKRYPNRKLYDTEAKRYVTLDEIAAMVRDEREVRVLDHESGEDVTSLTLTQIILEQEKKSSGYLPSALLTGLIRSGGSTLESWRKSLQQGISSIGALGRLPVDLLEEQINHLKEQGKLNYEQAQNLMKLDGLLSEVLHSLSVPTQRDLQSLQQQVEALNERLADLADPVAAPVGSDAGASAAPPDSVPAGSAVALPPSPSAQAVAGTQAEEHPSAETKARSKRSTSAQ